MPYFKDKNNNFHFLESSEFCYLLPESSSEVSELEYEEYLVNENKPTTSQIEEAYVFAIQSFLDSKAQEKRYDNIKSAALRAALPNSPFHAEGVAAGEWMDNCWALSYQIMSEVKNGERDMPTIEELISMLPELIW